MSPKAIVPSEGVANIIPNNKTAMIREIGRSMTIALVSLTGFLTTSL